MLAALLGIEEEEAMRRLNATVLVTPADDEASQRIAAQVLAMLNRTVSASFDAPACEAIVEVIVGAAQPRSGTATHVWVASVPGGILISRDDPRVPIPATEHPIFGLMAACYACGMALRFALRRGLPFSGSDAILVSPQKLLGKDLAFIDMPCDLGEAVLAGAGAVGNGFLYGLQHFQIIGRLHVVDPKHVHDGILNRCVWFTDHDLRVSKAIAIVNRAQAAFPTLKLLPHASTIKEFCSRDGAPALTRLISTVDSRRARRSLQYDMPREVFDASTTGIAEVVVHFNELPSELACLSCIYQRESGEAAHEAHVAQALGVAVQDVMEGFISKRVAKLLCVAFPDLRPEELEGKAYDTLFKARCAAGKLIAAADRQVLAPFCFVSMLAGAYLALELVRRINTGFIAEPFNYWRLSPWHAPVVELRALRQRLVDCEFCSNSLMRQVVEELWGPSAIDCT